MTEKINKNIKMALPCLVCEDLVEVKSINTSAVICNKCRNAILNVRHNFENIKTDIDKIKLKQALNFK